VRESELQRDPLRERGGVCGHIRRERAFTSRSGERERFRRKEREKELFGRDPARKFFSFKIFVPNTRWVQFHHPRKRPVPLRNLPNTDYTTSSLITQINKSNLKKTQISFYKKKREKDSIIHTQAYQQETEPPRPRCAAALPGPSCLHEHIIVLQNPQQILALSLLKHFPQFLLLELLSTACLHSLLSLAISLSPAVSSLSHGFPTIKALFFTPFTALVNS